MEKSMTNKIFNLKRKKIVRYLAYPFMNLSREWGKNIFRFSKDADYIKSLKNAYAGKRCFIIGNGPSLSIEDLNKLRNEVCFASNRIYTVFNKTDWRPQFYFALDAEIIRDNIREIDQLQLDNIFLDMIGKKYFNKNPNIHYFFNYSPFIINIPSVSNISFSSDVSKCVGMGYTVTYACMQFALYMGFNEIYLLGMDHSFSQVISSDGTIHQQGGITDHFNEKKNNSRVFQFLDGVNYSYGLANQRSQQKKAHIINATRGGKLEIFERCDFDMLIAPSQKRR